MAFNKESVESSEELIRHIAKHRPDDKIKLKILRDNRFKEIEVKLGERPR